MPASTGASSRHGSAALTSSRPSSAPRRARSTDRHRRSRPTSAWRCSTAAAPASSSSTTIAAILRLLPRTNWALLHRQVHAAVRLLSLARHLHDPVRERLGVVAVVVTSIDGSRRVRCSRLTSSRSARRRSRSRLENGSSSSNAPISDHRCSNAPPAVYNDAEARVGHPVREWARLSATGLEARRARTRRASQGLTCESANMPAWK